MCQGAAVPGHLQHAVHQVTRTVLYCTVQCTVHCTVPRELSTLTFVTSSPLLPDPYEARMVEVRQSEVEGAEDGLFSRRAVTAGTVLAFYNGIRRPRPEVSSDWWIRGHVT